MRIKMLWLSLAALVPAPALVRAAKVCDQAYHIQEATQYILTGPSASALTSGAPARLDKAMGSATILSDSTVYRIITDWDAKGSCDGWVKREVSYAVREKSAPRFVAVSSSDRYVRFFDGAYEYKKPGWDDYWFGIADEMHGDTALLSEEVGKFKDDSQPTLWYGAATIKITTRTKNGALVGTQTGFLRESASHPDSAALAADLLASWKDMKLADTQTVDFTLQMIRVRYDSLPSPQSGVSSRKAERSGFLAKQTGNLVLIQTGEKVSAMEPLGLFNMLGTRIATIHPTGFVYQWNGKTAAGADAPTGVYFVQAGNRVLGKFFFYSR
jgi:hypothetical protein